MKKTITGANPYMPLWEHIPDGEPRVFEHNGEKRIYLYGSHDTLLSEYCGDDYVVWSAPVDDMSNWTCHGVCYKAMTDRPLYAPDVVYKDGYYYMYVAEAQGSKVYVVKSETPTGPFTDPVLTELGFDPGILVDDDGRVYAYWGFCGSFAAELNDDMATIKKGTVVEHMLGHADTPWTNDKDHIDLDDAFFEASSPRKVNGKYVLVYSRRYQRHKPELGVYDDCNGFLSYKYSDTPLGGFVEGGDISFNGGEVIPDKAKGGKVVRFEGGTRIEGYGIMTYKWGNNHGSIMQVGDDWYVFYHRQTGTNEYSRQAMVEKIDVAMGKDGHLYIGAIEYKDGEPVKSYPVEMTSQGAQLNGLDAYGYISAGYACHIYDGSGKSIYITQTPDGTPDQATEAGNEASDKHEPMMILPVYTPDSDLPADVFKKVLEEGKVAIKGSGLEVSKKSFTLGVAHEESGDFSSPIINVRNKATIGFKYIQFGETSPVSVSVKCGRWNESVLGNGSAGNGGDQGAGNGSDAGALTINVRIDSHDGDIIAVIKADNKDIAFGLDKTVPGADLDKKVTGKHAVYFEFVADEDQVYAFDGFTFDK